MRARLRQAILNANSGSTPATINFDVPTTDPHYDPSTGVYTIFPSSTLPTITNPTTLAGTSQPGYSGLPLIELNGDSGEITEGLVITAGNSTVKGLTIDGFGDAAIQLQTGGGNVISGNYLGTNNAGNAASPNYIAGITIQNSSNNTIGGTAAAARNVISGNNEYGIQASNGDNNLIEGNYIGTDYTGTAAIANRYSGIVLDVDSDQTTQQNTIIGGTVAGAGNLISGNGDGITFDAALGTTVEGNLIGTDVTGTLPLPNSHDGISIDDDVSNTTIGGTANGRGNIIAFNGDGTAGAGGVIIGDTSAGTTQDDGEGGTTTIPTPVGDAVLGNSIFSNDGLGIDLAGDGVTLDDSVGHSGPNNYQNFPVITAASVDSDGYLDISGTLHATPHSSIHVELFANDVADPSGYGQGQYFLGAVTPDIITDGDGNASFSASFFSPPARGHITATATDVATNDTSEFSAEFNLQPTVTTGAASGVSSTGATLTGSVNAQGSTATDEFQYSLLPSFTPNTQTTLLSGISQGYGVAVDGSGNVFVSDDSSDDGVDEIAANGRPATFFPIPRSFRAWPRILPAIFLFPSPRSAPSRRYCIMAQSKLSAPGTSTTPLAWQRTPRETFSSPMGTSAQSMKSRPAEPSRLSPLALTAPVASQWMGTATCTWLIRVPVKSRNSRRRALIQTLASGLSEPTGVGVDAAGDVFISEYSTGIVDEIPAGGAIQTIGSGFYHPTGLTADAAGDVYINDTGDQQVVKLAPQAVAGDPSPVTGSGDTGISATLVGLSPGLPYFYRTVAFGPGGTAVGDSSTFTTDAPSTVVTNTADSGDGSLRQAILNANNQGNGTITFDIPTTDPNYNATTGTFEISPASTLPTLGGSVDIDGSTEPGFNATPLIQIDGSSLESSDGLTLSGTANTVNALDITNFNGFGLVLGGGGSDTLTSNYVGIDPTGTSAEPNSFGVEITSASNMIGGSSGNVISGNNNDGIYITGSGATGNTIEGNFIGTDAGGYSAVPNLNDGVTITAGASNNTIGGSTPNVISGNGTNGGYGVDINGANVTGNLVDGNDIGTNIYTTNAIPNQSGGLFVAGNNTVGSVFGNTITGNNGPGLAIYGGVTVQNNIIGFNDGEVAIGNSGDGIVMVDASSNDNTIIDNVIAENGGDGVDFPYAQTGPGTIIEANAIYDNTGLGIDLGDDGVTLNDSAGHSGPNSYQNFPVITSAVLDDNNNLTVTGTLHSADNSSFHIDIFGNDTPTPANMDKGDMSLEVPTSPPTPTAMQPSPLRSRPLRGFTSRRPPPIPRPAKPANSPRMSQSRPAHRLRRSARSQSVRRRSTPVSRSPSPQAACHPASAPREVWSSTLRRTMLPAFKPARAAITASRALSAHPRKRSPRRPFRALTRTMHWFKTVPATPAPSAPTPLQ